jgi:hypothetical protein
MKQVSNHDKNRRWNNKNKTIIHKWPILLNLICQILLSKRITQSNTFNNSHKKSSSLL